MALLTADHLRVLVRDATDDGDPLERVEREFIADAPLSDDHRAALWLYAWSARELARRRRARAHAGRLSALA